jgi:hypothetical protein
VRANVANLSDAARDVQVSVSADGTPIGVRTVQAGAGGSVDVIFDEVPADEVRIDVADPEGLQGDNTRYLVVGARLAPPVLVVTTTGNLDREAFYAQQALAAAGAGGAAFTVEGLAASALSSRDAASLRRYAAVVVTSTRGLERRGHELLTSFLTGGGGLLMAAGPDVDGAVAAGMLGFEEALDVSANTAPGDPRSSGRAIIPVDARHPIFRTVGASFGTATFSRIALVARGDCDVIARFTTGEPAMLDCRRGEGRALVFASDLNHAWNTLPRHAAFLPFLHESVRYLAARPAEAAEMIVGQTPSAVRPGFLTIEGADGTARKVAVNVDPRESGTGRLTPSAFEGRRNGSTSGGTHWSR